MPDISSILLLIEGNAASAMAAIAEVNGGLEGVQGHVAEADGAMALLGTVAPIVVGVGLALAGVGAMSVKMAADFDASVTQIHTQAGAFDEDLNKIKASLISLAGQVAYGPNELAQSLYHVESAGFRGAAALDMVRNAAELAQIGGAGLERTTQAIIGVMAAFAGQNITAGQAAAQLNAIVGTGDMRMEQLTSAMTTGILPAAATFGLTLKDVGAALATMTDNVTPADEAATRLRMTFALMAAPSGVAQRALGALGINATTLAEDMRKPDGLLVAISDLRSHLGHLDVSQIQGGLEQVKTDMESFGFTTDQVNQMVKTLGPNAVEQAFLIAKAFGGGRSSAAIMTLLTEFDRFKSKYAAIDEQSQKFGADWKQTQETFNYQAKQFRADLDATMVSWGEKLEPVALRFLGYLSRLEPEIQKAGNVLLTSLIPALNQFGDWFMAHQADIGSVLQAVGHGFQIIGDAFKVIGPFMPELIGGFLAIKTAMMIAPLIEGVAAAIAFLAGIEDIAAASSFALGVAMTLVDWPLLLLVAAIAAVIVVGYLLITHWGQVKAIAMQVGMAVEHAFVAAFNAVRNAAMFAINWVRSNWPLILGHLTGPIGLAVLWIMRHWEDIKHIFNAGIQFVVGLVQGDFNTIVGWFAWLYNHNYYFKDLVDFITNTFTNSYDAIVSIWEAIAAWLNEKWNGLVGNVQAAWNSMTSAIQAALNATSAFISAVWSAITRTVGGWMSAIGTTVRNGFDALVGAISGPMGEAESAVTGAVSSIASTLSGLASSAWQWGWNAISSFAKGITAAAGQVGDAVGGVVSKISSLLGFHSPPKEGPARDADKWMPNMIAMLVTGLAAGASKMATAALGFIAPISAIADKANAVGDALQAINPAFAQRGPSLVQDVKAGTTVITHQYKAMSEDVASEANKARKSLVQMNVSNPTPPVSAPNLAVQLTTLEALMEQQLNVLKQIAMRSGVNLSAMASASRNA